MSDLEEGWVERIVRLEQQMEANREAVVAIREVIQGNSKGNRDIILFIVAQLIQTGVLVALLRHS